MPELVEQQFAAGAVRDEIFGRVRAKFKEKTMAQWVAQLADKDICFGPVATVEEMMDDPQVRHREMVVELADRRGEKRRTLGNPLKLSATPPRLQTPPAEFGAHTDEVLGALGYSADELAALRGGGVV
jgi:crotonobetainyl-CoA:carnitine CoA-transferase CaiB-like acyl-CoA transferase